jgi:hypothetical protein
MLDRLFSSQSSASTSAVLLANKIANFLFVASTLLFIDASFDLGPTIIQATALSSILVSVVSPFVYTVLAGGYNRNAKITVDLCLLSLYITFSVVFLLSLIFKYEILFLILFTLSLSFRGICDAIISIEGRVFSRSIVILCVIEPIRWGLFYTAESNDYQLIIILLCLPLMADVVLRFKSYLHLSRSSLAVSMKVVAKVFRSPQLKIAYRCIFICQTEQLFILFWAGALSVQLSLLYIFAMQMVGLSMLFYLPHWMKLLQGSVDLSIAKKVQLIHRHTRFLYKTHIYLVVVITTLSASLFWFESINNLIISLMASISFFDQIKGLDIPIVLTLVTVLTVFKSVFMDINLLAMDNFHYRKVAISHSIFLFGLLILASGLFIDKAFIVLIGIYGLSYAVSVVYRLSEVCKR